MRRWRTVIVLVVLGLVLAPSTSLVSAQDGVEDGAQCPSGLCGSEAKAPEYVPGELIVRFRPVVSKERTEQIMAVEGAATARRIEALGVDVIRLPPGQSVEEAAERFNAYPGVEYAEPNYILHAAALVDDPGLDNQWAPQRIQAPVAWQDYTAGDPSVVIAVVDSGVDYTHSELAPNMWENPGEIEGDSQDNEENGYVDDFHGWDFVNGDGDPMDDNKHGTHVAGIAAAADNDLGAGLVGVCPNCSIMAVKVLDANGSTPLDRAASGVTYAANEGADVINLSLGGPAGSTALANAVDYAWSKDVVVVAAAGNDGANMLFYPAAYDNAIAVASTSEGDYHSCFSNYYTAEHFIDVAAPGELIHSTFPRDEFGEDAYGFGSGTSMAAPHVAGLAGLLFSQNPSRGNVDVRNKIETRTDDLGPQGEAAFFGTGRINACRALSPVPGDCPGTAPSPVSLQATSPTASAYGHARKLTRDANGILHLAWHAQKGSEYQVWHATSNDDGATWNVDDSPVFSSTAETYQPALALDDEYVYIALPSKHGASNYQIFFTRKPLQGSDWEAPVALISGAFDAVRPDLFVDPTNGRLHLVASSLDNAPAVYYIASGNQGQNWTGLETINPNPSGYSGNSRYATLHAHGDNVYVAVRTVYNILYLTYFYTHTLRSTDGGGNWSKEKQASCQALTIGERGLSLAGVGDRLYMVYEVCGNIYFRENPDGTSWGGQYGYELLEESGVWPTVTQASDGQAWMMFEYSETNPTRHYLRMRHYDGTTWEPAETVSEGNVLSRCFYPNLKLGTSGGRIDWVTTRCPSLPYHLEVGSRAVTGNNPPTADPQSVATDEDTAVAITLTGSDPDGDPLTFHVVTDPSNGTLSGTAPNLTYTPSPNYHGTDSFTFKANDGTADSTPATVDITVTPVNDPPVADPQSVTTAEDTPLAIMLSGSDPDGDPLTYDVVDNPSHGSLSGTAPDLTYTPDPGYSGPDSFTFKANDGTVDSDLALVDITVSAANDPPVADPQSVTTDEDMAMAITLTGSDPDGDSLTYHLVTNPSDGTLSGTAPNLTYTPDPDYNGTDSFTFKVNDGQVDSATALVDITVDPVNDPPVANSQSVTTPEDTGVAITLIGSDLDGDDLTHTVSSEPSHGTLSGTLPDLNYTPDPDYHGDDSFDFVVNDGQVDSAPATVSITVEAVNDPPVADDQSVSTPEDTVVAITLTGSDVDAGDVLAFSVVAMPNHGSLSGTAPDLTYTPGPDYNGDDSFTFKANDGQADSELATVSITVQPVNDPPDAHPQSVTTPEDTPVDITLTGSDVDEGDGLTFSVLTTPSHGSLSGTAPYLTYTPDADYNGADSFDFRVDDGQVDSASAVVSIMVGPANDPPLADSQSVTTAEDTAVEIILTGSDPDGDPLTFIVTSEPGDGILSGTAPVLTYTPNPDFNGGDSFTFRTNDGQADSALATVSITVDPVNDPPVADDQSVTTPEDTAVAITLTGSDVDTGDELTFSVVTMPSYGSLSGTAPTLTYTPNPDFHGDDSFTFKINDGQADSAPATASITVQPVNDPPVASFTYVCADLSCDFNAAASSDVEGAIASYEWDFGDGNGGSGVAPSHTYETAGTHSVLLTVTDNEGATDSQSHDVTVTEQPEIHVGDLDGTKTSVRNTWTASVTVTVHDAGEGPVDGATVWYAWSEGTSGGGTCMTDANGQCPTIEKQLIPKKQSTVLFTVTNVTHNNPTYDYNPDANHDPDGDSNGTVITVPPPANQVPVASFTYGCTDRTCDFTSTSYDPDGTIVSHAWDFGDSNTGSGETTSHTYAADGAYTVVLTATDDRGATDTDSQQVTIGEPANQPPVAAFTYACTDLTCDFDANGSSDPGGMIVTYEWDFGDSSTGGGVTTSHTYGGGGSYTVLLTVTDDLGAQDTDSQQVTVSGGGDAVHVGDLDGTGTVLNKNFWKATVTITVYDTAEAVVPNATVAGDWGGAIGSGTCTTDASGQCSIVATKIPISEGSVTFTVTGVTHALPYDASANDDPDGDSDGTSINIPQL